MQAGPGEVMQLIRQGAITRAQIQRITGLSRVTVSQRVDALLQGGLIRENRLGRSTGGRRPAELMFDHEHAILMLASVDTKHTRIGITDLAGGVLAEEVLEVSILDGPEATLGRIEQSMVELLESKSLMDRRIAGVGVSVPAPVDPRTGRPSEPPLMQGWDGYPIAEHFVDRFPVPVAVENDANVLALGERTLEHPDCTALCLVQVSTGIGFGIVLDGRIYTGSDGGAGDIGHVRAYGDADALCQCGSRGCLAAIASGDAVAAQLTARGVPAVSGRDVRRLLEAGETNTVTLTREAGRRIGEVVAATVCLLNPAVLVISGGLASNPLLAGIRETLYPRCPPRATRYLEVRLAQHGRHASFIGLIQLLVERAYGADAIDRWITT